MKFYSVSRLLLLGLTISFLFSVIISGIVFASSSENWVEVARFTGSDIFTTDYFTCNHVEWRIRWEIGGGRWPGFTNFSVTTFPQGEASDYVDLINEKPEKGNGTHYIHDNAGTFYMKIVPGYIDKKLGYTIIVEQNTDSNSEDVFAPSSNWRTVAVFLGSGTGNTDTDDFTCDHMEWRVKCAIVPTPNDDPTNLTTYLSIDIYQKADGESGDQHIGHFKRDVVSERNIGISYIHYKKGTFYLHISYQDLESYTIIIEQDLESIPEFPSWIILPLFLVATLFGIIIRKKLGRL